MATFITVSIGVMLLQICVSGTEIITIESTKTSQNITDLNYRNVTSTKNINNNEKGVDITKEHENEQEQRQKRGYNFNGYPLFSPMYPNYSSRSDLPTNGMLGTVDPLIQIHKRLSDIASLVRQPTLPPVPPATRYPLFVPFVYVPHINCGCATAAEKGPYPQPPPSKENKPQPAKPNANKNMTVPEYGTPNRLPVLEDDITNWGITGNDPEDDVDYSRPLSFEPLPPIKDTKKNPNPMQNKNVQENGIKNEGDDFNRPISFDPIPPVKGINKVPPPVEHGSVQGGINSNGLGASVTTTIPFINKDIQYLPSPETPTVCDGAILTCCNQARATNDCFALQGCPNPTINKNPCDANVILKVIERFQKYYVKKTG